VLVSVAMLAGAPPSYRSPGEIETIGRHLQAAPGQPLAAVLAALVREDFYDSDQLHVPDGLAALAAGLRADDLTESDWALLVRHVAPVAGHTWRTLRLHHGALPEYTSAALRGPEDPHRAPAVRRYFTPTPTPPAPVNTLPGHLMLGLGLTLILGIVVVTAASNSMANAFCASVVMLGGGIGLIAGSTTVYRKASAFRRHRAWFEQEWARAEPKPPDHQLDAWLRTDTAWITAKGAEQHRLNLTTDQHGGDLLVPPQTVVGISARTRTEVRTRMVPRPDGVPGFVPVDSAEEVPVALVREGDQQLLRSDHYHVLTLYLTRTRVCVYQCELDFATGRILSDASQSFRYDDVVEVSSRTVSANRANARLQTQGSGTYVETFADDRFELSIVNGNSIGMSIGFSGQATAGNGRSIAWGNQKVRRIVERMVWSQRENASRRA
jgi:hypothetical protein